MVVWSREVQHWLGYTALAFPGSKFIPPILGTVVFLYGGLVFTRGAWGELNDHKPGMMTLISLGIMVAFAASLAATFGFFAIDVWWEVAALITIMLLGHWLEMKAVAQARGALDALAALLPDDFVSTVAGLVIKNEISARRAAVLAYITNQLLRTLPIIQQENPPQIIFDLPHPKPTLEERRADPNSLEAASLKYYESLAP